MGMKILICALGIAALSLAGGIAWYRLRSSMKFATIKLLDKPSFIKVLAQIREAFSENFATLLKLNRKKRRNLYRGGKEYRICIRDLKDHARRALDKATADVLGRLRLTEEIFQESYNRMEHDPEVALAFSKVCSIPVKNVSSLLNQSRLNEIFKFTTSRTSKINEEDPNELNIKMKMIEDEIYEQFGFETEEIEAAVAKYQSEMGSWIQQNREINNNLLENTNEDLF
ncbi:unnamed protein product [Blepharisma stoltei]|uniref:Transmembrane protein n=1 Tax=Blepharisma stoltei TaxID=1481888 RepID=A0AAU9JST8_9CILI|nr:unnamed protein product [Blepharisma stoltei]